MSRARELADLLNGGQTITTDDNSAVLKLKSTDADATAGPGMDLVRDSGSPADDDIIGYIRFRADNDAGDEHNFCFMQAKILDASDGSEDAGFELLANKDGTNRSRLEVLSGETVFNEDQQNIDFRVESDTQTHMLFVDADSELVTIGTNVGGLFNAEGTVAALTVAGSDTSTTTTGNGGAAINISNKDGTAGNTSGIHFSREDNDGTPHFSGAAIVAQFPDAQATGEYPKARLVFNTSTSANAAPSEKMRLESDGNFLVGKTSIGDSTGTEIRSNGRIQLQTPGDDLLRVNRTSNDGSLILLKQDGTTEGTISVSGTTVTYGGGHLARWSRLSDNSKDISIVKGTVMTNLDQMVEWGDEDNEQLNCTAVSSTEGDANVAGVFVSWDESDEWNDYYVAMTGDMVIRIAQGTTVERGNLLMSAGDGTAKPQGDGYVQDKTIAKVTSTTVSHTYDDGSYLVPCVLMAC